MGFKLLVDPTEEEIIIAVEKVFASGVDMVIYNNLTDLRKGDDIRRVYYGNRGKFGQLTYGTWRGAEDIVGEIQSSAFFKKNLT